MKTTEHIYKGVLLLSLLFSLNLTSQEKVKTGSGYIYNNTIGVRFGETSGLSYKHIFNKGNAFEGIVSAWPYKIGATALYEKYMATDVPGLQWYLGGGGHIRSGAYGTRVYYRNDGGMYVYRRNTFATGLDGIVGVEYKFKAIPLALSTDLKPFTEITNYGVVNMAIDPGIGIKFTY